MYQKSLGENWAHFYDPQYTPASAPTFDDPIPEENICEDLFNISATRRPAIGMTTVLINEECAMDMDMTQPG